MERWNWPFLLLTVVLGGAGALGLFLDKISVIAGGSQDSAWPVLCIVLAFFAGMVGAILYFTALSSRRKLNAMVAGDRYVWWTYSPQQWEQHIAAERTRNRSVWWIITLGIAGIGVVIGLIVATSSDDLIADSRPITVLAIAGGFAVFGIIAGAFIHLGIQGSIRGMARNEGVIVGPAGLYVSGAFWAFKSLGIRLESFQHKARGPADDRAPDAGQPFDQMLFVFRVQGKNTTHLQHVHVPVPLGRETEGRSLVEQMRQGLLG